MVRFRIMVIRWYFFSVILLIIGRVLGSRKVLVSVFGCGIGILLGFYIIWINFMMMMELFMVIRICLRWLLYIGLMISCLNISLRSFVIIRVNFSVGRIVVRLISSDGLLVWLLSYSSMLVLVKVFKEIKVL